MPKITMKQVAVRMLPDLHADAIRMAKLEDQSFGEFVRKSVRDRIAELKKWKHTSGPDGTRRRGTKK